MPPSRPASSYTLDRKPLPRPDSIHQPRPTAQLGHGRSHPHRRYLTGPRLRSILYHSSFYLFCVLEAVLLVGTAWGLASQAWHGTRNRRWNIVLLTAAYVAVVCPLCGKRTGKGKTIKADWTLFVLGDILGDYQFASCVVSIAVDQGDIKDYA